MQFVILDFLLLNSRRVAAF